MHPIVENIVNEHEIKCMNPKDWCQAVISTARTWQTRGHHSKTATFSIRKERDCVAGVRSIDYHCKETNEKKPDKSSEEKKEQRDKRI